MSRLAVVAAVADNGVIGRRGSLPWRLPADLRRFRQLTIGRRLIMGRRTFDSIEAPLIGRRIVVLSRDPDFAPGPVEVVGSVDAALQLVAEEDEACVAGGGEIYRHFLPRADTLYVTRVHADVEGDVFFPPIDDVEWRRVEAEERPADADNPHAMTFEVWVRRR